MDVVNEWQAKIHSLRSERKPPPTMREAICELGSCESREAFALSLNSVLIAEFKEKLETSSIAHQQWILVELMLAFWSTGVVAWPAKQQVPFSNPALHLNNPGFIGPQLDFLVKIWNYLNKGSRDDASNFRFILDHLLSRVGVVEIGDLTPTTFYIEERKTRLNKLRSPGIQGILHVLREQHHDRAMTWIPDNFGFFKSKMGHLARDDGYTWLLGKDPNMKDWALFGKQHLETTPANYKKRKSTLNMFFLQFLENPDLPRNPAAYFDIRNKPRVIFNISGNKGRQSMKVIHDFLNEVLVKTCSQVDDNEIPILMPGFANPLPKISYRNVNKGETHRETMPTRLISQAMRILTENDFAWAKEVGLTNDTYRWKNPETGAFENIWSPVRAYALLIKLLLPARTYQVRHLDSGEGDTFRYEIDGRWIRNQGQHRPSSTAIVERGVFRKYKRKDGSEGAVIYFNTNKTADIDSIVKGFVMPWEKRDALELFAGLRNWQEQYNSIKAPTAWSDIAELKPVKHGDDLAKLGTNFFLFRDPCNRHRPDIPVTDVRVRDLWIKLMAELERRLKESGETLNNGDPIKLILTYDRRGRPQSAVFDLHALRVTIITAMYEEGVPPEFLMKIVGHATVLMTLHYIKLNTETLSLRLDEALLAHQRKAQSEMVGFIQKASRKELESAIAFRHPSSLDALVSSTRVGMLVMDHGICPVSAKRCHEGLAVNDPSSGVTKYQPVPGGATNCARCRFFMTGPAFLFGLEAHVNDLAYRLKKASFTFEKSQERFDNLSDSYAVALENGKSFKQQRDLEVAETAFEAATAEVDNIALSLQAAYAMTELCIRINNQTYSENSGFALVAAGGTAQVEAVLSESHEFEQLHSICTSATFFDGLKINWQQPNLERARLFDRILRNSGIEPRFSFLNDEDSLKIANEMGQFLYSRLSADSVNALVDGRTTLRAVGLEKAFITQLENLEPKTLSFASMSVLLDMDSE